MPAALLFDLDGTLVDSIGLILNSARHAFVGFTGRAPSDEEWRAGIGRPLLTVLREHAGDDAEAERLLARYREYQLEHHDRLMSAYPGIVDALRSFAARGHPLAVVTSKADWLARKALDVVGIADLFPVLVGCDSCVNHKPHPEPVERALALLGVAPTDAIFFGDSAHDVESGRGAGVYTVGVTWGAFSRGELEAADADVIIDAVSELSTVVERHASAPSRLQTF
jgi:pyrophosphatase PpaX